MYTKFKPWKQTKSSPVAGPTNKAPCDQLITNLETSAPPTLQFINTVHPSEAKSVKAIGAIRSHVAKEIHATRRQFKKQESLAPLRTQARLGSAGSLGKPESRSVGGTTTVDPVDAEDGASRRSSPRMRGSRIPNPSIWLQGARRNPFNRLAKPLNDVECFLIDYCMLATETSSSRPFPHKASQ
jgi:hypothetical protein